MDLKVEPKEVLDAYSTPIVQQTAFWSRVKERLGMHSCAFEYSVRNSDLYDGVGGFARTNADFIMFYQYLNAEDYVAYVPYGPEIEPLEDRQGEFLEELSEVLRSFLLRVVWLSVMTSTGSRTGANARTLTAQATGWVRPGRSIRRYS